MTFRFRLASRVLLSVFCLFVSERSNLTASHRSSDNFQLSRSLGAAANAGALHTRRCDP